MCDGEYRGLFLVPQPTLCSSCPASFLGDGCDAATTGDQTLAISRLDLVPSCRLPILFLGPQLVAGGETEAGQASGLPQGPRNPARGSLSLTQGTPPVEQDWPCAQYALPPGKAQWRANTVDLPAQAAQPGSFPGWGWWLCCHLCWGRTIRGWGWVLVGVQFAATVDPSCATKLLFFKCANLA